MRRLIALAAVVALVTAACKIETNFGAVINPDGSGTLITEIGMNDEAQGFFMADVDDPFEDLDAAEYPGARTKTERRGDMTFWIVEIDVDDINDLPREILGDANSMLDSFSITFTDDRVTVRGTASAEDAFGGGEGFDPGMFEESVSANIKITMPGAITSHNATSQRGNELTWRVPVLGGALDIQAESDPTGSPAGGGGGIPIWLIVAAAVVIGLAALYVLNQRKKGAEPQPAGTAPTEGAGEHPPPPPLAE